MLPVRLGTVLVRTLVVPGDVCCWSTNSFLSVVQGVTVTVLILLSFFLSNKERYLKFVKFSKKLAFLDGKFLEMGLKYGVGKVEFTEFLIIVDLFGGVLFFGSQVVRVEPIRLFGVDLFFNLLEGLIGDGLLLCWVVGVHGLLGDLT